MNKPVTKSNFLTQLKNEDWIATFMGAILVLLVIFVPSLGKVKYQFPEGYPLWFAKVPFEFTKFIVVFGLSAIGLKILGVKMKWFPVSFIVIYGLSFLAQYISTIGFIKSTGFEAVFFSVAIGLIIRNFFGLPKWLEPAVRSEFFIKAGLVILGTSILFGEIMKAGSYGMIQAVIVVLAVWYFSFWLSKKMGVDKEMGVLLSSAVSICGVSAAIATSGAIKGDSKKLSFVVSLVLVVAVPMMYIMPYLANLLGLSQEVAGAWLGGTIDTTGAVVAAGKFLGDVAESQSVIIKSSQNVLLGVAAFAISIYWSFKGTNKEIKPTPSILWERFPKFVLGFILASMVFSFLMEPATVKSLSGASKAMRETLFSVAFIAIGLETDFRKVFGKENSKYTWTFLIAQLFNVIFTLIVAFLLFGKYEFSFGF
ncbi:MAG: sulfate transporter [Bacteroidetes bacterium GWE2_39_28]|nr:MAG: sulfate transporter [Bacteroidetes bacterium GWE2_39_28]OFY14749.1 MAG: sulfate transporter [Bacteroidetes bacterium GWF2_39_10]OFZ07739.1 MAG: sulfate transporter [Bacteroidetes bacterium RIFOXYB2_FULL_39_7]OFZ10413.1 MAG: sulfate transporter [Bacteroidetes bacterium RIFOXYC2_FULL_39_11]HCT93608.1 putative sulfate exporter family transporter [Rikenellaceae bacterium]